MSAPRGTSSLSPAVCALVLAGATAAAIASQFLGEREGLSLKSCRAGGIWTACKGHTGREIGPNITFTLAQCDAFFASDVGKAIASVDRLLVGPISEPARAGIASFCAFNIGETKCATSTFRKLWNAGDRVGACQQIPRWIMDGGKDCRIRSNNCFGQVERRAAESELCLMGATL